MVNVKDYKCSDSKDKLTVDKGSFYNQSPSTGDDETLECFLRNGEMLSQSMTEQIPVVRCVTWNNQCNSMWEVGKAIWECDKTERTKIRGQGMTGPALGEPLIKGKALCTEMIGYLQDEPKASKPSRNAETLRGTQ